ncbi:MAG: hypothetical protein ACRCT1_19430, partial [Microcoleaceae cyanobacterium]
RSKPNIGSISKKQNNPLPIYNLEMLPKHPACHRQDACATGIRVVGWVEETKPNIFGSLSIPQPNLPKMAQVLFSRSVSILSHLPIFPVSSSLLKG